MPARVPKYCRQRFHGRPDLAYVKIDGRRVHLGAHGSPESRARYAELISEPAAIKTPAEPSADATVSELILPFLWFAKIFYRSDGGPRAYASPARTDR